MTTLIFEKAKWMADSDGAWLMLNAKNLKTVEQFCQSVKVGKKYQMQIKEHREKRSLDANAYAWALIDKLSEQLNLSPEEVYQTQIRDLGGNSMLQLLHKSDIEKAKRIWHKNGLGWTAEELGISNDKPDYIWLKYYYGSSVFDSKQMSRFIDRIIEECREHGIETLPSAELEALKNAWES